ncbi:MAG: hypothetical protein KDK07_07980 [Bauldia sp.]|nr:hypothetical protein [Bauldia sp.]
MKIRMLTSMAGADFALAPNDETDRFPAKEAKRLIEAGYAVPVDKKPVDKAVRRPPAEKRG